jgi:hypothetical protein
VVLGRSAGLDEAKLQHIGDDPLPDGVYADDERAIVEYAQRSTRLEPISDDLFARLTQHFSMKQVIEICFTVGLSNVINRFHATFLTDVDPETGDAVGAACPLPMPEPLQTRAQRGWERSAGDPGGDASGSP